MEQSERKRKELPEDEETGAEARGNDTVLRRRDPTEPVTKDDITEEADSTRTQLMDLQRKREELEREKNELEDLRRKQDEYDLGRKEMLEKLTHCLVILEHEEVETSRRAENVKRARESFRAMKEELEAIREDQWNNANLKGELTRALALVDTARDEYNHYRSRIDVLDEKRNPDAAVGTNPLSEFAPSESPLARLKFGELVQIGIAVSLPLLILGIIFLIVYATKQ